MKIVSGPTNTEFARDALILGCGFLGFELGRLLRDLDVRVLATTRSTKRHEHLRTQGIQPYVAEVDRADALNRVLDNFGAASLDVFCLLPPSALAVRPGGAEPLPPLVSALGRLNVRRMVVASSTAVYGDRAGAWVSAETPISLSDPSAGRLRTLELAWARAHVDPRIVRFAGLYGPGRIIGSSALAAGEVLGGDADDWLNLIHVSDAASLLIACTGTQAIGSIELGSDGTPVRRGEYYAFVADQLNVAHPKFSGGTSGRRGSRRCDPASTMERTGWMPRYRNYKQGVRASIGKR